MENTFKKLINLFANPKTTAIVVNSITDALLVDTLAAVFLTTALTKPSIGAIGVLSNSMKAGVVEFIAASIAYCGRQVCRDNVALAKGQVSHSNVIGGAFFGMIKYFIKGQNPAIGSINISCYEAFRPSILANAGTGIIANFSKFTKLAGIVCAIEVGVDGIIGSMLNKSLITTYDVATNIAAGITVATLIYITAPYESKVKDCVVAQVEGLKNICAKMFDNPAILKSEHNAAAALKPS